MTTCKNEIQNLILIHTTADDIAATTKAIAEQREENEKITARQKTQNSFLIYIEPNNAEIWSTYLENKGVNFRWLGPQNMMLPTLGMPVAFLPYFTEILPLTRISLLTTVNAAKKAADCRSMTLIKSGLAQGDASEVTVFSSVSPETIAEARSKAIGSAAKEAAEEMAKAQAEGSSCAEPCQCRYLITYGAPTDAGSTENASGSVSGDLKGVSGSANVGKVTTVSAHVNWSLWKTCVKEGDSGFGGTAPIEHDKTVTIAGTVHKIKCKVFFETTKVKVVKEYADDISWTEYDDAAAAAAMPKLREEAIVNVLQKAADEAGKTLLGFDPCPTTCPKASVSMFISSPETRTTNTFKRPHAVGYDYVTQVVATCSYWVYKNCE